ncbi:10100_t:CDS:2, partial [Funneliformis caledonium]
NAEAKLDKSALAFLQEQEIFGEDFLALTLDALKTYELKLGLAGRILRIIDKIQKGKIIDVNYTSCIDSEVENMTTGMSNLITNNNVNSPSRRISGKLLRKLCKAGKILTRDILRYTKGKETYDCVVTEIDDDFDLSISFTYKGEEHKKSEILEVDPFAQ